MSCNLAPPLCGAHTCPPLADLLRFAVFAFAGFGVAAAALPETFTLSSGDGVKTVYLWTKDTAGNVQSAAKSASMELDTAAPTIEILINTNTSDSGVSKTVTASSSGAPYLFQYVTTSTTCDSSLSESLFTDYNASLTVFSANTDNNKRVCYLSKDYSNNKTYKLSDPLTGIVYCALPQIYQNGTCAEPAPVVTYKIGDSYNGEGYIYACNDANNCTSGIKVVSGDKGSMNWDAANSTCVGLAGGWGLPSVSDLDLLYVNKGLSTNLPQSGRYWGNEFDQTQAYSRNFSSTANDTKIKTYQFNVRCVKSF